MYVIGYKHGSDGDDDDDGGGNVRRQWRPDAHITVLRYWISHRINN